MRGGKLIGTGSSSCVFLPNIPCKTNGNISQNRVTKLLYHHDSKNLSKHEKKQSDLIKKINGYKDWAIIYDEFCKAPKPGIVNNLDPEGFIECFGDTSDSNPYDHAELLTSDYGGETLKLKFREMFINTSSSDLILNFRDLIKMCEPLFLGLKEMDSSNIVHNDIKTINIIESNNKFKYIDFGLANKASNIKHFRERSINEASTSRLYYYYPLEYIYFFMERGKLQTEMIMNIRYRRNYNILKDIYAMFDYNIDDVCLDLLNKLNSFHYKIKDVIKKIDVYSLGLQIPVLFYENGLYHISKINNQLVYDFFELFKKMINPNLDERLTAKQAYEEYVLLMKKHSIVGSQKKNTPVKKIVTKKTTLRKPTKKATRKVTPRKPTRKVTPRKPTRKVTPRRDTRRRRTEPRRDTRRRRTEPRRDTRKRRTEPRRPTVRRAPKRRVRNKKETRKKRRV